ncbi:hypothetical protein ACFXDJ_06775 [Streptomyces sp. NPDC059443]
MSGLRERDPWGWRQQLAALVYVIGASAVVITLALAGRSGR